MPPVPKMSKRKRERLERQKQKSLRSSSAVPNEANVGKSDEPPVHIAKPVDHWVPPNFGKTTITGTMTSRSVASAPPLERPPICTDADMVLIKGSIAELTGVGLTLRQIYAAVSFMLEQERVKPSPFGE